MSLTEFKASLFEFLLDHVWKQWSCLGIAGQMNSNDHRIADPEALLLFSTSIARHDQRIFDEILDWLKTHERLINIQRLKTLHKKGSFGDPHVVAAIAGWMDESNYTPKWKTLIATPENRTNSQSLFFLQNGSPMPVIGDADPVFAKFGMLRNRVILRNLTQMFQAQSNPTLLLQLRSLMGLNCRSEIIAYLLTHGESKIPEIAEACGYSWKTVQDTLHEMSYSNLLRFTVSKKNRTYTLDKSVWVQLLQRSLQKLPEWENWAVLYQSLEKLSYLLEFSQSAANLHYAMCIEHRALFDAAGIGSSFALLKSSNEQEYFVHFLQVLKNRIG